MGIITKEVEVKPSGKMIKYYRNKGYNAEYHKSLMVKVEDLPEKSNVKIQVLCDYCKKEIISVEYNKYLRSLKNLDKYSCKDCKRKKEKEIFISKYDVYTPFQLIDVQEKSKKTLLTKYGVDNALKSPEIKEKKANTLYKNHSQKCSKQQYYIFNLYKILNNTVELNYPISHFNVDICFLENKLIVEYDGGFHMGNVMIGRETLEEFNQKEIIRNNILKKEGYKQMRIISTKDLLPSDEILLQMLTQTKEYFSNYPNHSWIEYNIDTSTVRNAEQKDGVFFDYGELRRIKEASEVA